LEFLTKGEGLIYVILGMHKSGTTLVAEILHHSGINMVEGTDTCLSYDQGNKYERKTTAALNRAILDTKPFIDGFSSLDLPAPKTLRDTDELRARIRLLVEDLDRTYGYWGFKDPRTCWTYPVWASELPEHRIIVIYRTPDEIWPRYRQLRRPYKNPYLAWKFMIRWCEYNSAILACFHKTEADYLVLNYRELMETQTEFDRLQQFIGFDLEDRRVASLRRNRPGKYLLLRLSTYFTRQQIGCTPDVLIEQLETLRQR
jgi:hypothetical protein